MFVRKAVLIAAILGSTVVIPASAEDGVGVATSFAGVVTSASALAPTTGAHVGSEEVAGQCEFFGFTRGAGFQYTFAGKAVSASTSTDQPTYTEITCTLTSPWRPGDTVGTQSASCNIGIGAAATACANLDGVTPIWPARPVQICVDGYAHFGPVTVKTKTIPHAGKDTAII
jgi:hypothetical protein